MRASFNQAKSRLQAVEYKAFGETMPTQTSGSPGTANYTSEQWNGGDLLRVFGVVQLGDDLLFRKSCPLHLVFFSQVGR
jgi:hypothetical protein